MPWIWIAIDTKRRQIIAFYARDRRRANAKLLWAKYPSVYCAQATFYYILSKKCPCLLQ
jgi:hypothetical protein